MIISVRRIESIIFCFIRIRKKHQTFSNPTLCLTGKYAPFELWPPILGKNHLLHRKIYKVDSNVNRFELPPIARESAYYFIP